MIRSRLLALGLLLAGCGRAPFVLKVGGDYDPGHDALMSFGYAETALEMVSRNPERWLAFYQRQDPRRVLIVTVDRRNRKIVQLEMATFKPGTTKADPDHCRTEDLARFIVR